MMDGRQNVIFTNDVVAALDSCLDGLKPASVFFLCDGNTETLVLPELTQTAFWGKSKVISVQAGDEHKDIAALQDVWTALQDGGATRLSVLVNVGGGVVTDLGGFAAATFKRGIRFINVPTTLLGAVDAAVGGKTGINYNGYKNEIGAFREASVVIVSARFFKTLPAKELKSGYAEMIKHGLLSGTEAFSRLLDFDLSAINADVLLSLLEESVEVKRRIVAKDPTEKGLRKALNLGHTAGHAFESLALHRGKPVPHGYAVAWGLVVEAVLSKLLKNLDSSVLYSLSDYVRSHYGAFGITCDDYNELLNYMKHDKKSAAGEYNFSLLHSPGDVVVDCVVDEETVKNAFDIYRDLMHI